MKYIVLLIINYSVMNAQFDKTSKKDYCNYISNVISNSYPLKNQEANDSFVLSVVKCNDFKFVYSILQKEILKSGSDLNRLESLGSMIYYNCGSPVSEYVDFLLTLLEKSIIPMDQLYLRVKNNQLSEKQEKKLFNLIAKRDNYPYISIRLLGRLESVKDSSMPILIKIAETKNNYLNDNILNSNWQAKLALARLKYGNYNIICVNKIKMINNNYDLIIKGLSNLAYIDSKESYSLLYKYYNSNTIIKNASKPSVKGSLKRYVIQEMEKEVNIPLINKEISEEWFQSKIKQ